MTTSLETGAGWRLERGGLLLWHATQQDVDRLCLTLQIAPDTWQRVLRRYAARAGSPESALDARLETLAAAFADVVPRAPLDGAQSCCPLCGAEGLPAIARPAPEGPITWSRCCRCRHLFKPPSATDYSGEPYYLRRDASGVGYDHYDAERDYRVAKGTRLLKLLGPVRPGARLLDVGCGYGYTLAAAKALGYAITGLDTNPHAADRAARELGAPVHAMGLPRATLTATVRTFDVIVYQFVLEHVADPWAELQAVRRALAAGGRLLMLVPSGDAAELNAFHGAYRSLRADHLHLFSRASLEQGLARADLRLVEATTECNLHLLRGFASVDELSKLYADGLGPDWVVTAEAEVR
ncbi:MAG: class I SAM-dependent methyltransferase [Myxococcaceae bacterium]